MKNIEHITRIRCACGATVEVESSAVCHTSGGYMSSCNPEIDFDAPDGWLGGYGNEPIICPACVEKKYASNKYRIVHFVPDPFTEGRVPIGALVEVASIVHFVPVDPLPYDALVGRGQAAVVRLVVSDLTSKDEALSFEKLPESVGPQVIVGPIRVIPFQNPIGFVKKLLNRND